VGRKRGGCGGLTLAYGAHTFLCADTILSHGSQEQKQRYLPKLASGEWIGCMGLTEPGAGSDVASISTRAERKGDYYVLNGNKMFITNGPVADVAVVYAKTEKDLKRSSGPESLRSSWRRGHLASLLAATLSKWG